MDGDRPPYAKRTARKTGNWANPHLQYSRYKSTQQSYQNGQPYHNGHHDQQEYGQTNHWDEGRKTGYGEYRNGEQRSQTELHRSHEARRPSGDYWTNKNQSERYDTLNGDYWRQSADTHNGLRNRHDYSSGRYDKTRRESYHASSARRDGEFHRPREPRDQNRGRGSFRRTLSHDAGRQPMVGREHRRRDSETSQSSITSGIEWDTSRTEGVKLSARDPRLIRGQDYKIRLNSVDSGVPDTPVSVSSTNTGPQQNNVLNNPVNNSQPTSKKPNHQTIIDNYNQMCDSLSRSSSQQTTKKDNERDHVVKRDGHVIDHVADHVGHVVKRTGSPRVLSVDVDTGLVCGTTVSVEELLRRKHGSKDPPKLEPLPLPPCPPVKPPIEETKRLLNRSISSPADISHRRVLAPKPSNIQDALVPYRGTTIAPEDSLSTILRHDNDVRKDVIVASVKTSPVRPPSILKNSVERIRSSKSSLARKLPSNPCLTSCQGKSKKRGVRFSFPSCVPGRRRTWNSISSNFDLQGNKLSPKRQRSPKKDNKGRLTITINNRNATSSGSNNSTSTNSAKPAPPVTGGSGQLVSGRGQDAHQKQGCGEDKKVVKQQLFLTTFGEPMDLAKKEETDTDAASALLMLSDAPKDMPTLTPIEGADVRAGQLQKRGAPSPVDFPPVLSPQSPPNIASGLEIEVETSLCDDFTSGDANDKMETSETCCSGRNVDQSLVKSEPGQKISKLQSQSNQDQEQKPLVKSSNKTGETGSSKTTILNVKDSVHKNSRSSDTKEGSSGHNLVVNRPLKQEPLEESSTTKQSDDSSRDSTSSRDCKTPGPSNNEITGGDEPKSQNRTSVGDCKPPSSTQKLTDDRRTSKVKKKRARRATIVGSEVKQDIDDALKTGLVKNAINPNRCCVVKIQKMDDKQLADISTGLSKLEKTDTGSECVGKFLSDDVTRSDTGDSMEEPEVASKTMPVAMATELDAAKQDAKPVEGEQVVERRRSKKRVKVKTEPPDAAYPSPSKVRIKSEPLDLPFEQAVQVRFQGISQLLQECHTKIGLNYDNERSLFSTILSEKDRINDMQDTTLPDLVKTEPFLKPIKMDIAKLKLILSPHRIKQEMVAEKRVKRSHSEECLDILTSSIKRIKEISEELSINQNRNRARFGEASNRFRLPLKHQFKQTKQAKVGSVSSRRKAASNAKRPSVIVSLPLGGQAAQSAPVTAEGATGVKVKQEPISNNESQLSEMETSQNASNVVENMSVTSDCGTSRKFVTSQLTVASDASDAAAAAVASVTSELNAPSISSEVTSGHGTGEEDKLLDVSPSNLDPNEPDTAVSALLESQKQSTPSPAVLVRNSSPHPAQDDQTATSQPSTRTNHKSKNNTKSGIKADKPVVKTNAVIEGVVLSLGENGAESNDHNESTVSSYNDSANSDALSDALQSSGLGTLVASQAQTQGDLRPCPVHGCHPPTYHCQKQVCNSNSQPQKMIAGPPVPYGALMGGYQPGHMPVPMMPIQPMMTAPPGGKMRKEQRNSHSMPPRMPMYGNCGIPPPGLLHAPAQSGRPPRPGQMCNQMYGPPPPGHNVMGPQLPMFRSPPRPSLMPAYPPMYKVHAPVFSPPKVMAPPQQSPAPAKPPRTSQLPRPTAPSRKRHADHVTKDLANQDAVKNHVTNKLANHAQELVQDRPLCQQITVDLAPRRAERKKRTPSTPEKQVYRDMLKHAYDRLSGPAETVLYSDVPLEPIHPGKLAKKEEIVTLTVNNSGLVDSTFPHSDSSYVETDHSRCRQTSFSSIDNTQDMINKEVKFSENLQEKDTSTPKSEVDTPEVKNDQAEKPAGPETKLFNNAKENNENEDLKDKNMKEVYADKPDTTENKEDEVPSSSTDDSPEAVVPSTEDAFPYIPKLHWQSEPLDLSVKLGDGKEGPIDLSRRTPSSEEYFVGFPLKALPPKTSLPQSDPTCTVTTTNAVESRSHMVPLQKIATHQVTNDRTVCYSPCPRPDDVYQKIPPLLPEHALQPAHACNPAPMPPNAPLPQQPSAMPSRVPSRQPQTTYSAREREYLEKRQSQERRKILEENRQIMEKGNKEIVESRLQGVYSPLNQSTIDPNYPQMMYPTYPYVIPFGAVPMYQPTMMMGPHMGGQPTHGQPMHPGTPMPSPHMPGHPQNQTLMPPPLTQPMGPPMGQPMMPQQPMNGPPMGYYPPMSAYNGFMPPQPMYRAQPYEQKKRKKKPRGHLVQQDAHPLSDIGATSEDSENLSSSVPTTLKRRILDRQNDQVLATS